MCFYLSQKNVLNVIHAFEEYLVKFFSRESHFFFCIDLYSRLAILFRQIFIFSFSFFQNSNLIFKFRF